MKHLEMNRLPQGQPEPVAPDDQIGALLQQQMSDAFDFARMVERQQSSGLRADEVIDADSYAGAE